MILHKKWLKMSYAKERSVHINSIPILQLIFVKFNLIKSYIWWVCTLRTIYPIYFMCLFPRYLRDFIREKQLANKTRIEFDIYRL